MGLPRITTDPQQQQQNSNSRCGWSLQVEETAGSLPPSSPRLKRAPQPAKKNGRARITKDKGRLYTIESRQLRGIRTGT